MLFTYRLHGSSTDTLYIQTSVLVTVTFGCATNYLQLKHLLMFVVVTPFYPLPRAIVYLGAHLPAGRRPVSTLCLPPDINFNYASLLQVFIISDSFIEFGLGIGFPNDYRSDQLPNWSMCRLLLVI